MTLSAAPSSPGRPARLRSLCLPRVGLLLALAGCATSGAGARSDGRGVAEAPAQRLFRAAGDQAVVTVLVDPRRFGELRDVEPLLSALGRRDRERLQPVVTAPSLWTALGALARSAAPWPAEPAGWDPTRPLVLSLFAAPPTDTSELALSLLDPAGKRAAPPLYTRHRVLIPARDPGQLQRSLEQLLANLPRAPRPREPGVYGHRDMLLVMAPADDHLRIEILLDHNRRSEYAEGTPTGKHEPPWGLLPLLKAPPPAAPPETPAQRFASAGSESLTVYLRPDRLRAVHVAMGGGKVFSALAAVDPQVRAALASAGFAELAGGELLLTAGGGEIHDSALGLSGGAAGVSLTGVLSLTAAGLSQWAAAARGGATPQLLWSQPLVARAALGLDVAMLVKGATPPPGVPVGGRLRQLMARARECGGACSVYLGLRHPLGVAHLAAREDREGIVDSLPRGGAAALIDANRDNPRGAAAAVLPSTPLLAKLLLGLNLQMMRDEQKRMRLESTALPGGLTLHRFGLAQDPAAVYATAVTPGGGALWELEVDAPRALAALGSKGEELSRMTAAFAGLRQRVQLSGPALVGRTMLARAGVKVEEAPLPVFSGAAAPAADPPAGELCLRQAQESLVQALSGASGVDPAQRAALLGRAAEEMAAALRPCGQGDSQSRARGERLLQALDLARRQLAAQPPAP